MIKNNYFKKLLPAIFSFILLFAGILMDHLGVRFFDGAFRIVWYVFAYLPVAFPVIKEAVRYVFRGEIFTEFFLMFIATVGAFAIKQYPEAVGVMLFYFVGEFFQDIAVDRAQANIKELIDQRPDVVTVLKNGTTEVVHAKNVPIDTIIQLKPGEKLALDGELLSDRASFSTSALTGESKPDSKSKGERVLAGMMNLNTPAIIRVTATYEDSKLSEILELVQHATEQKAPTELFIRKFSRYYTPAVVLAAVLICFVPMLFVQPYVFSEWFYKALIFLVISCPCALVISVPLSYFGAIGAASKNGILFKGSNYVDIMASLKHVVMDKTGTLTAGVFKVKKVVVQAGFDEKKLLQEVNVLENVSTHPVATAIAEYVGVPDNSILTEDVEEIPGFGLKGVVSGRNLLVGNMKLLDRFNVSYDISPEDTFDTVIAVAVDGQFAGYITIADQIKEDAKQTIEELKKQGIKVTMLSGDKNSVVQRVANFLGIEQAFGDLLPNEKLDQVMAIKRNGESVAFVGDGVNDAPVLAASDAGIAMGGLGSHVAIEIADIVIQNDEPSKIPVAIKIGKATKRIVWQNIIFAFSVKLAIMILGVEGISSLWEAVFADVGVALLAILNAMRMIYMNYTSDNSATTGQ